MVLGIGMPTGLQAQSSVMVLRPLSATLLGSFDFPVSGVIRSPVQQISFLREIIWPFLPNSCLVNLPHELKQLRCSLGKIHFSRHFATAAAFGGARASLCPHSSHHSGLANARKATRRKSAQDPWGLLRGPPRSGRSGARSAVLKQTFAFSGQDGRTGEVHKVRLKGLTRAEQTS